MLKMMQTLYEYMQFRSNGMWQENEKWKKERRKKAKKRKV